jgi:hypothetical protein
MILNDRDKEMGPLATVAEAARKIEYVKLLGHSVRIKQSTIDAIIAEGTVEPLSFDDFNKPSIQRRALKLAA